MTLCSDSLVFVLARCLRPFGNLQMSIWILLVDGDGQPVKNVLAQRRRTST